ncbi:MAG: hypothetical protein ABIT05_13465 [Chitinophagaceae bacterium]
MKNQTNPIPSRYTPDEETTSYHLSPTTRLSDNAFYLIALASLLRRAVEPGQLKQFLVPGVFAGYGLTPTR